MKARGLAVKVNRLFEKNYVPGSVMQINFILLHKDKNTIDLNNYTSISLLPITLKILTRVVVMRVEKSWGLIYQLKSPISQRLLKNESRRACQLTSRKVLSMETATAYHLLNFKKAFNTIKLKSIWETLGNYELDQSIVRMTKQLCVVRRSCISLGTEFASFETQRDVSQRNSLFSVLFILTLQHRWN